MNKKTLHIDTLYLSYSCDLSAYKEACEIIAQKNHLYYRDGRQFYDFGYARVGWLDWELCERSGNYPFVIEYNFEYLYQTDLLNDIQNIELPFSSLFDSYLIKRLDYNCTFIHKSKDILQSIFISKYFQKANNWYDSNLNIETVNLGKRKTGKTFRIYNKTKELHDKKLFIKADMLKQVFGSTDNLFSLEVEIHRKYILSKLDVRGSLSDWIPIIELAKVLLGSIRYCKNTPQNIALIRSNNYEKIDFEYIDEFLGTIPLFKQQKKYIKSRENLLLTVEKLLEQYNSYEGEIITPEDLAEDITYFGLYDD